MKINWKRFSIVVGILIALGVLAVNILGYNLCYPDSIPIDASPDAAAYEIWISGSRHVLRGRISRLCLWRPDKFTITATVYGKDGNEVESKFFPQHGGSRISLPVTYVTTSGIWHYYLTEGWPDCLHVIPWGPSELPESFRDSKPSGNRYLDISNCKYIKITPSK